MRVLFSVLYVALILPGCASIQSKIYGTQVAVGPCKSRYVAWQQRVEVQINADHHAAAALLQCLRDNGVKGPIALVTHDVYGATPPPVLPGGVGRRNLDVDSLDLSAFHYSR